MFAWERFQRFAWQYGRGMSPDDGVGEACLSMPLFIFVHLGMTQHSPRPDPTLNIKSLSLHITMVRRECT
jgi:hypothetical protein